MFGTSLVAQSVKNPPTMKETAWNAGDPVSIPGLGRSSGEGNGNPLQSSCLGNAMNRGAWWVKVHGVAKSQTWLNNWAHSTRCLPLFLSKYLPNPLHFCPLLLSLNLACLCVCVCVFSYARLFTIPWTTDCLASLSLEISKQEHWSVLPFSTLGDLPDPEIEPSALASPELAGGSFTIVLGGSP